MRKGSHLSILLLILSILTACGKTAPAPTVSPSPSIIPSATALPQPSPTGTPAPTMALLASPDADPRIVTAAQAWLQTRAQEAGAQIAIAQPSEGLPENTTAVLSIGAPPPKAPTARRLMIAASAESVPDGVQALVLESADLPHRAFLAGYIGTLITKDWRTGLLASEAENAAAQAFKNGGHYYCGLCRPLYPPFLVYPLYALIPAGSNATAWESGVQELRQGAVKTLILSPAALQGLTAYPNDITLIALDSPPNGQTAGFAAVLTPDIAGGLDALWAHPDTATLAAGIQMAILDNEAISPGRAAMAEEVRQQLQNGLILP